ncbi:type I phosphomannose isomerase catalytic subunit [Thermophilibacter sp. ZX-H3]|uniref:type I phosphomannose isomerase catalytic subunit n=1 Tax=Atopobiaceae TaxID=1643824 RepID=UPI00143B04E8|nr:type I phosphomannose isomerase catalytic subunit [Olsenella sp. SW781]NJE80908.1 class I mannose-6-phosphate isomerase [Olsenella sp. SW781]
MPDTTRDLIFPTPIFHEKIWGGRKLADDFGYEIPDGPIGECWAISAHPNGDCAISGGAWDGMRLSELWDQHRELFGGVEGDRFPLLVKIIDAKDNLSVQVHPDDAYAAEHENGSLGKRECWYVLAADEGTQIVIGQRAHDRAELASMIDEGRWDDMLNLVPCHVGDFFPIEPGTVHAIQGGTLILETQQSSDVTYRVYDYDRVGDDGKPRELHIQQSLDVVDYAAQAPASGEVTAPEVDGVTELMECPNFVVDRVRVSGEKDVAQPYPFLCVSVIEGSGTVCAAEAGVEHEIARGTHFLAPAGCGTLSFSGDMTLVTSHLPE